MYIYRVIIFFQINFFFILSLTFFLTIFWFFALSQNVVDDYRQFRKYTANRLVEIVFQKSAYASIESQAPKSEYLILVFSSETWNN